MGLDINITSEYKEEDGEIVITIYKFPTHVQVKKKARTPAKYIKVNGQKIYSSLHYIVRNKLVDSLRKTLSKELMKHFEPFSEVLEDLIPLELSMEWHVPPNWETLRYSAVKEETQWKELKDGLKYDGMFDVDNQWIWIKVFTDAIAKDLDLLPDDNVPYIPINGRIAHFPVGHLSERKLVFRLRGIKDEEHINLLKRYYKYGSS